MKLIIAGGRDLRLNDKGIAYLDWLNEEIRPITEIVSGCAAGIDTSGERYARLRYLPIKRFPANWDVHGRVAGPVRNAEMARYADAVVLFQGGKGTNNMHSTATIQGIEVFDCRDRHDLVTENKRIILT